MELAKRAVNISQMATRIKQRMRSVAFWRTGVVILLLMQLPDSCAFFFSCEGRTEGMYPEPASCQYVYMCAQDTLIMNTTCPAGLYFNEEQHTCVPWEYADDVCFQNNSRKSFSCAEKTDGVHAHETNCIFHFTCRNQALVAFDRCEEDFYFNSITQTCEPYERSVITQCTRDYVRVGTPKGFDCSGKVKVFNPDPESCITYHMCFEGRFAETLNCSEGFYFHGDSEQCVPYNMLNGECNGAGERITPSTQKTKTEPVPTTTKTTTTTITTYSVTPDDITTPTTISPQAAPFNCAGRPDDYHYDHYNCSLYHLCLAGRYHSTGVCPERMSYDSERGCTVAELVPLSECVDGVRNNFNCADKEDDFFPDEITCKVYHLCTEGRLTDTVKCKGGQLFHAGEKTCVPPEFTIGQCEGDKRISHSLVTTIVSGTPLPSSTSGTTLLRDPTTVFTTTKLPPINQNLFNCTGKANGYYPDDISCSISYLCYEGALEEVNECQVGFYFSVPQSSCVPEEVTSNECQDGLRIETTSAQGPSLGPTRTATTTPPTTVTTTATTTTLLPSTLQPPINCTDADDLQADAFSCTVFHACHRGRYKASFVCPEGFYFSQTQMVCGPVEEVSDQCVGDVRVPDSESLNCTGVIEPTFLAHPSNCSFYHMCMNATVAQVFMCFGNTMYESLTAGCMPSSHVQEQCTEDGRRLSDFSWHNIESVSTTDPTTGLQSSGTTVPIATVTKPITGSERAITRPSTVSRTTGDGFWPSIMSRFHTTTTTTTTTKKAPDPATTKSPQTATKTTPKQSTFVESSAASTPPILQSTEITTETLTTTQEKVIKDGNDDQLNKKTRFRPNFVQRNAGCSTTKSDQSNVIIALALTIFALQLQTYR
ncbi:uncharacterized protein LOC106162231 [Lingula anatina]|uniref:Uncharacterized protein LOC106162231 n=1 Tax=Lingula anatina TaxID=7574 RepID=A0A1S3I9P6_LINAN|nr:uncharacterized protein LOC106162231 [Lingula anatina]|eukprot:XP_013394898.1 uncharacterized protein LOC106162231 [Lingula anatina]